MCHLSDDQNKERLFSGDSYEDAPNTPTQEANTVSLIYITSLLISALYIKFPLYTNCALITGDRFLIAFKTVL